MPDQRMKDRTWIVSQNDGHSSMGVDHSQLAVLMDLRDELQAIRRRLDCYETQQIPRLLKRISANTAKPRKPKGGSS